MSTPRHRCRVGLAAAVLATSASPLGACSGSGTPPAAGADASTDVVVSDASSSDAPIPGAEAGFLGSVAIGTPCRPILEQSAMFGGYEVRAVSYDTENASCGGGLCLVNHFQGLTSCPYGQESAGMPLSTASTTGCVVPGSSTPVDPPVAPWCTGRLANTSVICSCLCGSAQSGCTCPAGYTCAPLIATDSGIESFCIQSVTEYDGGGCELTCGETGMANCN
jgi:hypothetical protein